MRAPAPLLGPFYTNDIDESGRRIEGPPYIEVLRPAFRPYLPRLPVWIASMEGLYGDGWWNDVAG